MKIFTLSEHRTPVPGLRILTFASISQDCNNTRTQLYQELLLEHKKVTSENKKLLLDCKKLRAGIKDHVNDLAQQVKDLTGEPLSHSKTHN